MDFAEKLGVSLTSIQYWEYKDKFPKGETLFKISKDFGVSIDWLFTGEGPQYIQRASDGSAPDVLVVGPDEAGSSPEDGILKDRRNVDPELFDYVPMAEAKLSAGTGMIVYYENILDYYAFRKDWLRRVSTAVRNLMLMNVRGDSMEPTLREADTVMVDMGRKDVHSGYIYAIGVEDTIMVKRLDLLANGVVRIFSDNKAVHEPYEACLQDIRIIGQIIWFARQMIKSVGI